MLFEKGKVYKIRTDINFLSMGWNRNYIIFSPLRTTEVNSGNIPFLFCINFLGELSLNVTNTRCTGYNCYDKLETLTEKDLNELRILLSSTNIRYNRKTKRIIEHDIGEG